VTVSITTVHACEERLDNKGFSSLPIHLVSYHCLYHQVYLSVSNTLKMVGKLLHQLK